MRDGPLRRTVKLLARLQYAAHLRVRRAVSRRRDGPPWTLEGACQRSGCCCEAPAIAVGPLVFFVPLLRRLFLAWQRIVDGFELARVDGDAQAFVFRCSHFDRKSRSCDSYDSRPAICRDYPRQLLWQPNPELFPACGYRCSPPNARGLRTAIEALDLTPEKRERLRKALRLK